MHSFISIAGSPLIVQMARKGASNLSRRQRPQLRARHQPSVFIRAAFTAQLLVDDDIKHLMLNAIFHR